MSTQILILGAGKSTTFLIEYLQKKAVENNWYILLADHDFLLAKSKWNNQPCGEALGVNIIDPSERAALIQKSTVVVSMLPATLHYLVAEDCIKFEKSLFTASYVDDQLLSLQNVVVQKGLLFLSEMGLDPGIDHMSAMQLIDKIKGFGGKITGFKSHCGGIIAPESDTNPWHYKISWNPRNVILAGKAGAIYLEDGLTKQQNYTQLFVDNNQVTIPKIGALAYYPNRNSLCYIDTYSLQGVDNFVRTTLRYPDFCKGWNALIQLGFTDETKWQIKPALTLEEWFLALSTNPTFKRKLEVFMEDEIIASQLNYLSLTENVILPDYVNSNASLLQWRLEQKWTLNSNDKDLVVMMHEIDYTLDGKQFNAQSSMIIKGIDGSHTAMAKTVGYPLAMGVCAFLNGEISLQGIHLPIHPEIYTPILENLAKEGIIFEEQIKEIKP